MRKNTGKKIICSLTALAASAAFSAVVPAAGVPAFAASAEISGTDGTGRIENGTNTGGRDVVTDAIGGLKLTPSDVTENADGSYNVDSLTAKLRETLQDCNVMMQDIAYINGEIQLVEPDDDTYYDDAANRVVWGHDTFELLITDERVSVEDSYLGCYVQQNYLTAADAAPLAKDVIEDYFLDHQDALNEDFVPVANKALEEAGLYDFIQAFAVVRAGDIAVYALTNADGSDPTMIQIELPTQANMANALARAAGRIAARVDGPVEQPDGNFFDPDYYAQNNADVVAVYGLDPSVLYQHYLKYGMKEGRLPYASDAATFYFLDGTVFDAAYYAQTYPAVAAQVGSAPCSLLLHYIRQGRAAGLRPCAQ